MNDELQAAGERFFAACQKREAAYAATTEDKLKSNEGYLGRPTPPVWREFLLAFGHGISAMRFTWPKENMHFEINDAAEHQVETDDGHALAAAGSHVLGYIEGVGDCVILDKHGQVHLHGHGGSDHGLGSLAEFITELARRMEDDDGVVG